MQCQLNKLFLINDYAKGPKKFLTTPIYLLEFNLAQISFSSIKQSLWCMSDKPIQTIPC